MTPLQIAALILGFGLKLAETFGLPEDELKSAVQSLLDQDKFASDKSWADHLKNLDTLKDPRD